MAENLEELFGIEELILIDIIQESTKNCAYVWNKIGPTLYEVTPVINGTYWVVRVGRVSVNNSSTGYYLEFLKEGKLFVTLSSSVHPEIISIFETVEEQFSFLPDDEQELLEALQDSCRCLRTHNITTSGGVVVGGSLIPDYLSGCVCSNTDILLVVDTTGSMGSTIAAFRDLLSEVIVAMDSPTCRIGLVTYRDFEDVGDYANGWKVNTGFTDDFEGVVFAVGNLSAGGGGDGPEQQLATLQKAALEWETTLGGRPTANRAIAWVGDIWGWAAGAKGHDYPTVGEVITALTAANIQVIALNPGSAGLGLDGGSDTDPEQPKNQATDITDATAGTVINGVLGLLLEDVIQQFCDSINVSG